MAAVVALLTALVGAPATAKSASSADPAIATALAKIAANRHSAADIRLIKRHPELARVVADPSRTTVTKRFSPNLAENGSGAKVVGPYAASELCGWVVVTVTVETILGFDLFVWNHRAEACMDGTNVTRWLLRYDQMIYADPTIYVRNLDSHVSGTPASQATSVMQRHLEQCIIRYGCYANWYPWSAITYYGNYYYSWDFGVG
ncbi:hypothetical protein QQG74_13035 [Micromonospora sp. FIMYZ51]|uniref:hypothetical protein n=1 Tax=Micromonospora sp. FIMYZ51 TaxID=3051832 RepID=UPI00311ECA13